jgi:hypothetical protein
MEDDRIGAELALNKDRISNECDRKRKHQIDVLRIPINEFFKISGCRAIQRDCF